MLLKTHIAIGVAVALYFLPFVNNGPIFLAITLIASILPDIGSGLFTRNGRIFRNPQEAKKGILHTYTFCILISLILVLIVPVLSLPFFIGYSFHLLADSFTKEGIMAFWPYKKISSGIVKTGGTTERAIFITFLLVDAVLLVTTFARLF